jgi:hypothetical protein
MLENTEGVKKRTIQRNWQHIVHKTQDKYVTFYFFLLLPVSLDCLFVLPLRYSLTFICYVSCVPYVASFSGLSFGIAPSVFSNIYLSCVLCVHKTTTNKQSRDTGNIGYNKTQDK